MIQRHQRKAANQEGTGDHKSAQNRLLPADETRIEKWVWILARLTSADQRVSKVSQRIDRPDEWMYHLSWLSA